MMYGDASWGWWWMGAVVLVVALIVVAVTVAVALAARPRSSHVFTTTEQPSTGASRATQPSAAALEALDVRFARGEIDEETYRRTRELLSRPPGW